MEIQSNSEISEIKTPTKNTYLYRIENTNTESNPDGITSHEEIIGQWFTPNIETAILYLRKSQQTFGMNAQRVNGANLLIVKIPEDKLESFHADQHPIASQMDHENDNYIIPKTIKRNYINIDDIQDKVGIIDNLQKAKKQIEEKIEQFKQNEAK